MSLRSHTALLSDPAAIRRQFPLLTREGLHYLDSAATAQMPEAVIAALQKFGTRLRANVYGGVYKLAQEALAEYEAARADVARFLGAVSPQEVVLTYGTTSSLNLLAQSFGERLREGDEIVLSILEHHSNTLPWRALARRRRANIRVLPMTPDGRTRSHTAARTRHFEVPDHCGDPLLERNWRADGYCFNRCRRARRWRRRGA